MPETQKPRLSILMVTYGQLEYTIRAVKAVQANTKDYELIVVDNASTDGTPAYLLDLERRCPDTVRVILNDSNRNFGPANNQALAIASGEYVVALNNDTRVTPGWAEQLIDHVLNNPTQPVGFIGPLSNSSNGRQQILPPAYVTDAQLAQFAQEHQRQHRGEYMTVPVVFGWCLLGRRSLWEELGGFDEQFENAYEDNDICLRAMLKGYRNLIAADTYIDHFGQATLRTLYDVPGYVAKGKEQRQRYMEKYNLPGERQKLVVVMRLANCYDTLKESLQVAAQVADEIIVHLCRNSDQRVEELLAQEPKVTVMQKYDGPFQEDYERNWLHEKAVERGADWILSVDGDEVYEQRFVRQVRKLMNPRKPEIMAYIGNWRTLWDDPKKYRADGIFGNFKNYRFYRAIPGMKITNAHPEGHHCGSAPIFPEDCIQWWGIRVKHLGYQTREDRKRKWSFYHHADHFKDVRLIGTQDYSHLLDDKVELFNYDETASISLNVMAWAKDEDLITDCLERMEPIVDEIVVVDTGLTVDGLTRIERFGSRSPARVRVVRYDGRLKQFGGRIDNYSRARNLAKRLSTKQWILFVDPDEAFEPAHMELVFKSIDRQMDAYMFHVCNYTKQPVLGEKESEYKSTLTYRLFRNDPRLFFSNPVHETLDDAVLALRARNRVNVGPHPATLHHHGYLRGRSNVRDKMDHYEFLNNWWLEVCGGADPRPLYNVAMHYLHDVTTGGATDRKRGLQLLQQSLALSPYFFYSNFEMAQQNLYTTKYYLEQAMDAMPDDHPFRAKVKNTLDAVNVLTVRSVRVPDDPMGL